MQCYRWDALLFAALLFGAFAFENASHARTGWEPVFDIRGRGKGGEKEEEEEEEEEEGRSDGSDRCDRWDRSGRSDLTHRIYLTAPLTQQTNFHIRKEMSEIKWFILDSCMRQPGGRARV